MTQQQQPPKREIVAGLSTTTQITIDITVPLQSWLAAQISAHAIDFQWLLLHAETGVVWGERRGDALALSAPAAALGWSMLLQARFFGKDGEILVWQGPQGWQARLVHDGSGTAAEWIDEQQMLWGNRPADEPSGSPGFMTITEGSQGITHAPPIGDATPTDRQRARLLVRHYLGEDDAGVVRISGSRLVKLLKPGE